MEFLMASFQVIFDYTIGAVFEKIFDCTIGAVFEKILNHTIGAVGRQIGYAIFYKSNVENLNRKVMEIEVTKQSVQDRVEVATNNVEKIEDIVQKWLSDVEDIMAKVGKFFEDEPQAKMNCSIGPFPNLKARYQLGKRAYNLGLEVKEINDRGMFSTIGYRERIQGRGTTIPTKGYEDFESRKSIFEGVMKALKEENIRGIGVYGMGGTGKTMLVGKVARQAMEEKLFEEVVTIVVSQTPNLKKIQKDIAKELGLEFKDEETDLEKTHLLHGRLNQGKKILIIVDDIWKKLDLEALGISFEDDLKGCKILLTSRSKDVLVKDMDAQEIFPVGVLSDDEATYLFRKIVGDLVETLDFQSIVVEVIEECGRLPIALTAVAHALKSEQTEIVWKDALRQLRMANPIDIEGMHEKVYPSIKLSYNVLSKEAQSLFLFCSTFQEDVDIRIEFLWRLLVGLDFFEDVFTMEQVRNRVYTLVKRLKACCLLLEGEKSGTVKMHDVIRDVSIYIADKEEVMLTIRRPDNLKKLMNPKVLEDSILMALYDFDYSELPERLECPQVKLIILEGQWGTDLQIPNLFFEGMKNLKVLVLKYVCLPKLPSSLLLLDNLQALHLIECKLEDIAMIGELKNLKVLNLTGSKIRQLPKEIEQLTDLKLLDLTNCYKLEVIPPNVLSNLKKLEELYMKRSFDKWEIEEQSMERRNARISDLDNLSNLTTLQIKIPNVKILSKFLFLEKLERYEILIGYDWDMRLDRGSEYEPEILRKLKLRLIRSFQLEVGIKKILKSCECLYLGEMEGVDCIPDEDFPKLKYLHIKPEAELQFIISWTGVPRVAFPLLESIFLGGLIKLEKICHGQLAEGSFGNLTKLEVVLCDSLRFMFSSSVVGSLSKLQEIDIRYCEGMSAIVAKEREEEIEITTNTMEFPQLRCIRIMLLPSLMGFYCGVDSHLIFNEKICHGQLAEGSFANLIKLEVYECDSLRFMFSSSVVGYFSKLQEIDIRRCNGMRAIVAKEREEEIEINDITTNTMEFPQLRCIRIEYLPSLMGFYSGVDSHLLFNEKRIIQNLEKLEISSCDLVEEVFEIRSINVEETFDPVASMLRDLKLCDLRNLKHVWSSDPQAYLTFQNLREVKIEGCIFLKSVFPISVAKSLTQLEELKIKNCGVEEIVAMEEGSETTIEFVLPRVTCLELEDLPELKCFYPRKHTSKWPSLKRLKIYGCPKVKIVSLDDISCQDINGLDHHLVPIQQPLSLIEKVEFHKLEEIYIRGMDNLMMLWHNLVVPRSFCKLQKLIVDNSGNQNIVFPRNMLKIIQNLEMLEISNCASVKDVFEETIDPIASMLRDLKLCNLPNLKHVWSSDPQAYLTYQNLREVEIDGCIFLKSVFPISVAKSLTQLEELRIKNCGVEEIVAMEEGSETTIEFVLPRVTCLELEDLPELKCFYPRKHTSKWPSLERLKIYGCPKVKIVSSDDISCQDINGLDHHHVPIQRALFWIDKDSFPHLEELMLDWSSAEPLAEFFRKQACELYDKFSTTKNFCNLNTLHVKHFFIEEIYPHGLVDKEGQHIQIFEGLSGLELSEMPNLLHLWNENSQPGRTFQYLYDLKVSKCGRLKNLVPSSISFQNLNYLEVSECHGLSCLVTKSTAKSLVQLSTLVIIDCKRTTEIVTDEGEDEAGDEISFRQLNELQLHGLPNLKGFNLSNRTIRFPLLNYVTVTGCPELKMFSNGVLSTPKLKKVELAKDNEKLPSGNWEGDLNTTIKRFWEDEFDTRIQQLFTEKDTFPNLEELMIDCDCAEPLSEFFQKQQVCELYKYRGFSPTLAQGLCSLKNLHVRHSFVGELCPYELFDKEGYLEGLTEFVLSEMDYLLHLWNENSQPGSTFQNLENLTVSKCGRLKNLVPSSISFQNLHYLEVSECHGLSCLVTSSVAKSLVQLRMLVITECNKMTEIVRDEEGEETGDEISFSQLQILRLHCLPCLKGFNLSNPNIRFPLLNDVIVTRCPELKMLSNGVLSTPKLNKVILAEDNKKHPWSYYQPINGKKLWEGDLNSTIKRFWEDNFDTCIQQLFTEKANESTGEDE